MDQQLKNNNTTLAYDKTVHQACTRIFKKKNTKPRNQILKNGEYYQSVSWNTSISSPFSPWYKIIIIYCLHCTCTTFFWNWSFNKLAWMIPIFVTLIMCILIVITLMNCMYLNDT